jgi:hypothetical protein
MIPVTAGATKTASKLIMARTTSSSISENPARREEDDMGKLLRHESLD